MSLPTMRSRERLGLLGWGAWCLLVGILTYGLLSPDPPKVGAALLPPEWTFTASKLVHLSAYALLSGLIHLIPATLAQRLLAWVFLAAHGASTEYLQQFVEGRYGSPRDVYINWAGLFLGLLLGSWLVRLKRQLAPASQRYPTDAVVAATATSAPR